MNNVRRIALAAALMGAVIGIAAPATQAKGGPADGVDRVQDGEVRSLHEPAHADASLTNLPDSGPTGASSAIRARGFQPREKVRDPVRVTRCSFGFGQP